MNKVVAVFWDNEYEVWSTEGVKIIDTIVMDNNLVNVNYLPTLLLFFSMYLKLTIVLFSLSLN